MKAELLPKNGDPPIPITRDVTVIGRREYCDVVIDHPSLSKRHCVLVRTDGLLMIRDLATTNGTKVNGQKVLWAALLPNDRLALGAYKMRVYLGADDTPSPSEQDPRRVAVKIPENGRRVSPPFSGPAEPFELRDDEFATPTPSPPPEEEEPVEFIISDAHLVAEDDDSEIIELE